MAQNPKLAVYWQTWSTRWTSDPTSMDLVKDLDERVGIVYLAFAMATGLTYKLGDRSCWNTGLQFSQVFDVVAKAISILRARGVIVMLSGGGGGGPGARGGGGGGGGAA